MHITHYNNGKKAIGVPKDGVRGLRWIIREGEKILQQQKYGIPTDFEFYDGQKVVEFFWYWEDVPTVSE